MGHIISLDFRSITMTTIASFISKSDRGNKNLYVISDSRITWKLNSRKSEVFDYSTKVFPFYSSPDILAYNGDSTFALSAISRIKMQLEFSEKFKNARAIVNRVGLIHQYLDGAIGLYPKVLFLPSTITYFSYCEGQFFCHEFKSNSEGTKFDVTSVQITNESEVFYVSGSGGELYKETARKMTKKFGRTVHVYFYAFFCHIKSAKDTLTGGAPQIVMIDSKGVLKPIAIVINNKANFMGEENKYWLREKKLEYRNERFQLLDSGGVTYSHEKSRSYLNCID